MECDELRGRGGRASCRGLARHGARVCRGPFSMMMMVCVCAGALSMAAKGISEASVQRQALQHLLGGKALHNFLAAAVDGRVLLCTAEALHILPHSASGDAPTS